MTRGAKIAMVVVLLAAGAYVALLLSRRDDEPARGRAAAQASEPERGAAAPALGAGEPGDPPAGGEPAEALPRRLPSAEARQRLERDIARARERRLARAQAAAVQGSAGGGGEEPPAGFDAEYIRDRVRELLPMIKQCYENTLATNPDIEGTLVVDMVLAGEPDVGGIVESSEIDLEASTLTHPDVAECLAETMHALEIEPPPNGGTVRVRYPFTFRPH